MASFFPFASSSIWWISANTAEFERNRFYVIVVCYLNLHIVTWQYSNVVSPYPVTLTFGTRIILIPVSICATFRTSVILNLLEFNFIWIISQNNSSKVYFTLLSILVLLFVVFVNQVRLSGTSNISGFIIKAVTVICSRDAVERINNARGKFYCKKLETIKVEKEKRFSYVTILCYCTIYILDTGLY